MDHVSRNRLNNILYCYSIENNEENFQKLAQVINKRDYIYKQILYRLTIVESFLKILVE